MFKIRIKAGGISKQLIVLPYQEAINQDNEIPRKLWMIQSSCPFFEVHAISKEKQGPDAQEISLKTRKLRHSTAWPSSPPTPKTKILGPPLQRIHILKQNPSNENFGFRSL